MCNYVSLYRPFVDNTTLLVLSFVRFSVRQLFVRTVVGLFQIVDRCCLVCRFARFRFCFKELGLSFSVR